MNINLLDWYIIKKFLGTYIFMIVLIISIAVVFDINEKIDKFITHNASLQDIIFDYYLNTVLPDINRQKILAEYLGYLFIKTSVLKL